MKRSSAVFPRIVTWLVCGSACLGAALGVGCMVETAPPADELDDEDLDDLEFRADGCGAQRKKGTVAQTCKYTIKSGSTTATKGTCSEDGDTIECEFEHKPCWWSPKSTTAPVCLSGEPQCPSKADEQPLTYKTVYSIGSGEHICDPDNQGPEGRRNFCHNVYLVGAEPSKLIDGKPLREVMAAECLAKTTPDVVKDVECCVAKPPGGGSSGGDSGEGSEGDTACSTSGDATSWEDSGDDGLTTTSGSGDGECPDGSSPQCSGGDGAPYSCTCVVDAPELPPGPPPPPGPMPPPGPPPVPAW